MDPFELRAAHALARDSRPQHNQHTSYSTKTNTRATDQQRNGENTASSAHRHAWIGLRQLVRGRLPVGNPNPREEHDAPRCHGCGSAATDH